MTERYWLMLFSILLSSLVANRNVLAAPSQPSCSQPALSKLVRHQVAPGETLASIAQKYNLIPATLIGMNPALQTGQVAVGSEIVIPPYNGIRLNVPKGQTWQQLAAKYKVRADVLFEINGCQTKPKVVFIPGVNWSPPPVVTSSSRAAIDYPLAQKAEVALGYGWQLNPSTGKVFFHSGLDLVAPVGTPVDAVATGTVAFAGEQGSYGNLVVINHQGGNQSRYAQLQTIAVKTGQVVKPGDLIGKVGTTGSPSSSQAHLHFELRYASKLGWTAEDPTKQFINQ
ncbi:LysM peptidoglycan-binding domain-containing M23 family metallopeptidase [Aliterella atlantica]|uniref:Peptidase n=1 Tax=Aliterella atlantica CENA595 TaxID=1618023 RepID=A0A0D8ZWU0_9CYAN|nr:peptidase [Aliterella atlantica CENA595]